MTVLDLRNVVQENDERLHAQSNYYINYEVISEQINYEESTNKDHT